MRKPSLLQTKKECFVTGRTDQLELHHVWGGPNRKISDQNGFWVWLTKDWHTGFNSSVHLNPNAGVDLQIKKAMQTAYERKHSREEFIKLIGKSYL